MRISQYRLITGLLLTAGLSLGATSCTTDAGVAVSSRSQTPAVVTAEQSSIPSDAATLLRGPASGPLALSTGASRSAGYSADGQPSRSTLPTSPVPASRATTSLRGAPQIPITLARVTPSPGNIHQTIAPRVVTTAPPVDLSKTASDATGLKLSLTKVQRIQAQAQGPGEISGPALAVTVKVQNGSSRAVPLNNFLVSLSDARSDPGTPMTASPASPLNGSLPPGQSSTGTYVFSVKTAARTRVSISVTYEADSPVIVFTGSPA